MALFVMLKELNVECLDDNLVIVKGKSKSSKFLTKALPLGDYSGKICKDLRPIFGYEGSLQRAVGHWIKQENIPKVKKWLENERIR